MADDSKRKYDAIATFNANFQIGMAAPLDNRDVVRRYAHLVEGIGLNHYMGQIVYVTGEFDETKDLDHPTVNTDNIVESEVGYYYFKNETEGWVKMLTIVDGGSGGGGGTTIPIDVLPVDEPNGVAPLDENGLVPSGNLPSYVDDVIEGYAYYEGTDPNKYLVFYKKQIIEGYYYNGAFYSDSAHTTVITPSDEKYYYDKTGSALYYYDSTNSEYVAFYQYEVIEGYYYNGAFYSDSAHTTVITPAANKYYKSLVNSLVYYYDTENTEYKLVDDEDAPFIVGGKSKIYVDLLTEKTYRWSGTVYTEISNTQVSKSFTTNIAVGGIPKGTVIKTTDSLEDVLKKILINVYQPVKTTDASTDFSKTAGSTPVKIGIKTGTYTFKIEGKRGEVKLDGVSQGSYAGAVSQTDLYLNNTSVKTVTSSTTPQSITVTVSAVGNLQIDGTNIEINDQPVSTTSEKILRFKGGVTFGDGQHYNDSTGTPSTTLPAFVSQELQSGEINIEIVCPVYANTDASSVGVTVEQNAVSKSTIKNSGLVLTLPKHKLVMDGENIDWANSTPYTFEIPAAWTLSKVEWYNDQNGKWETKTGNFDLKPYVINEGTENETTVYTHNITVNGVTVSYQTYYYNVVSRNIEQNKFKVFITY